MPAISRLVILVLPLVLCAGAVRGAEEIPPAAETQRNETSITDAMSFAAPTGTLTSVEDLRAFVNEFSGKRFDTSRAAKVEGLVIKKESCDWKLDGFIFLREATRGIRNRAIFFGKGEYRMTPPIAM